MQKIIRKSFFLLTLILFLFPQVEKVLHEIEHINDFHCNEKSSTHLHELSHDCKLCEYNIKDPATPPDQFEKFTSGREASMKIVFSDEFPVLSRTFLFLLRAPPIA